jgi:regulatory protein
MDLEFTETHQEIENDQEDTAAERKKAYNYAIRLLAKRDYSVFKMRQKFREKGYASKICDEVIDELLAKNYLQEELYIEARIKGFLRKGYAPNVILYRLSQEQCHTTQEQIESIMSSLGLNSYGQLYDTIEKKLRLDGEFIKDKEKLRQKVLRYCISRGYSISDSSRIYSEVFNDLFPNK